MGSETIMNRVSLMLAALLLFGSLQLVYAQGGLDRAESEFQETAHLMQMAIEDNEKDLYTDTMNYDTYKVALNSAMHQLSDSEKLVHINVSFGSLDRGLKYINDHFGHLNGGPCIQDFAMLLKEVFPSEDGWVVCHRGGSGFLVFSVGDFTQDDILDYYNVLKARWHDTPYVTANGNGTVEGMALLYLAVLGPDCGENFQSLRNQLVYKKLALRDVTNCGYVIQTAPDHYISSVEIDEAAYMED